MTAARRTLLLLTLLTGLGSAGQHGAALLPAVGSGASEVSGLSVAARVVALLPRNESSAQVVSMGSQIATVNLQQRVTSVGGSPAALKTVLASIARGQQPSYDSRLGITRSEFTRYLAFQPTLVSSGKTVHLSLLRSAQRLTLLEMPGAAGILRGLSFNLKTGELQVPEGFTFSAVPLAASTAKDRSIDLRGGVCWMMRGYDPVSQNGIQGQLQLYQLGNDQTLLTYSRTSMLRGIPSEKAEVMLTYAR